MGDALKRGARPGRSAYGPFQKERKRRRKEQGIEEKPIRKGQWREKWEKHSTSAT